MGNLNPETEALFNQVDLAPEAILKRARARRLIRQDQIQAMRPMQTKGNRSTLSDWFLNHRSQTGSQ